MKPLSNDYPDGKVNVASTNSKNDIGDKKWSRNRNRSRRDVKIEDQAPVARKDVGGDVLKQCDTAVSTANGNGGHPNRSNSKSGRSKVKKEVAKESVPTAPSARKDETLDGIFLKRISKSTKTDKEHTKKRVPTDPATRKDKSTKPTSIVNHKVPVESHKKMAPQR